MQPFARIVLLLAALAALAGCLDTADVASFRNDLARLDQTLAQREAAWRAELDRLDRTGVPQGDPVRQEVAAGLAEAGAAHAATSAALGRVDQIVTQASDPASDVGRTVGLIAPLLPAPARAPVLLGAALLLTALRAWQLKRGLVSVVQGLQRAKRDDETFAQAFQRHANTFRASQTPAAQRIVNDVINGSLAARIPL